MCIKFFAKSTWIFRQDFIKVSLNLVEKISFIYLRYIRENGKGSVVFSGFNGLMVFNEDLVFAKLVGHIKEVLYKEK